MADDPQQPVPPGNEAPKPEQGKLPGFPPDISHIEGRPKKYNLTALNWAESFVLKDLVRRIGQKPVISSGRELVFEYGENRYLFLYSFGVIAFFNLTMNQRAKIINLFENSIQSFALEKRIEDEYTIELKPAAKDEIGYDKIVWNALDLNRIRMVAKVLAESVAVEYTENLTQEILGQIHHYTKELELRGRLPYTTRELVRSIGFATTTREHIVANFYVIDKPEETWDDPTLEKLYLALKEMFDLDVRYRAIEQKLEVIHESVEVIVDLVRARRDMILELLIIALIAFEVVLFLFVKK